MAIGLERIAMMLGGVIFLVLLTACGGGTSAPVAAPDETPTPTLAPISDAHDEPVEEGRRLFLSKGCAACHGQDAQGSEIAPAVPGHSEAVVKRQVRNPRLRMPAFTEDQVSDEELEAIAHYIASLTTEGHAHPEAIELTAAVEMHHWMALEALKVDDAAEAIHHVEHIIELVTDQEHRHQMEEVLDRLGASDFHEAEHAIEGMLAGTAELDLELHQLHLRLALAALDERDLEDVTHHVQHFVEVGSATQQAEGGHVLELLEEGDFHGAEHEIEELLGIPDTHDAG